eukprot:m.220985 g.220985  ORF g.220985 m.220985 type:complete len:671 (-) comp22282_c0_seq4:89-2101(-)
MCGFGLCKQLQTLRPSAAASSRVSVVPPPAMKILQAEDVARMDRQQSQRRQQTAQSAPSQQDPAMTSLQFHKETDRAKAATGKPVWLQEGWNRSQAVQHLTGSAVGAFVLYPSASQGGNLDLSVQAGTKVCHALVRHVRLQMQAFYNLRPTPHAFENLLDLVAFFAEHGVAFPSVTSSAIKLDARAAVALFRPDAQDIQKQLSEARTKIDTQFKAVDAQFQQDKQALVDQTKRHSALEAQVQAVVTQRQQQQAEGQATLHGLERRLAALGRDHASQELEACQAAVKAQQASVGTQVTRAEQEVQQLQQLLQQSKGLGSEQRKVNAHRFALLQTTARKLKSVPAQDGLPASLRAELTSALQRCAVDGQSFARASRQRESLLTMCAQQLQRRQAGSQAAGPAFAELESKVSHLEWAQRDSGAGAGQAPAHLLAVIQQQESAATAVAAQGAALTALEERTARSIREAEALKAPETSRCHQLLEQVRECAVKINAASDADPDSDDLIFSAAELENAEGRCKQEAEVVASTAECALDLLREVQGLLIPLQQTYATLRDQLVQIQAVVSAAEMTGASMGDDAAASLQDQLKGLESALQNERAAVQAAETKLGDAEQVVTDAVDLANLPDNESEAALANALELLAAQNGADAAGAGAGVGAAAGAAAEAGYDSVDED